MKTIFVAGIAVAAGLAGAFLFSKYHKKKGDCGCSGAAASTPAGSTTPGVSTLPATATPPIIAPGAVSALAADGKSGWVQQPKSWH